MYHFVLGIFALFLQVYSISWLRNKDDKDSRYSFWYNILSIVFSLAAFYFHFIYYFKSYLPIPQ